MKAAVCRTRHRGVTRREAVGARLGIEMNHDDFRIRGRNRLRLTLAAVILAMSAYANVPKLLGDRSLVVYVPPFREGWDANMVDHLGGEYLCIARSLVAGRGFASPFRDASGPTAWMPPLFPLLLATLLTALRSVPAVSVAVVLLQDLALIATGWATIDMAARTSKRPGAAPTCAIIYLALVLYNFKYSFQFTHDQFLGMALLTAVVCTADRVWGKVPSAKESALWGGFGGLCALASPILGFVWGVTATYLSAVVRRPRSLALSVAVAMAVISPWVARNYVVFHRFIPIKSNLFYELYQSNNLEPDGILHARTFDMHPFKAVGEEWSRYKSLGEPGFLDLRRSAFLDYLSRNPRLCLAKLANRMAAATVIYVPFDEHEDGLASTACRIVHPLPTYAALLLLLTGAWRKDPARKIVLLVYASYLLPYVLISYYERYEAPLIGLRCLLCFWAWDVTCELGEKLRRARLEEAAETVT